MKPTVLLLIVSLATNAVLLLWHFGLFRSAASTPDASGRPSISVATTAGRAAGFTADMPRIAGAWSQLQSDDLPALVTRLRAAGFPSRVIRSIVAAQVAESFASRRREIIAQQEPIPFWQAGAPGGLDPKLMLALLEIDLEQRKTLRALLGPEGAESDGMTALLWRRQFGDEFPLQKADQIGAILADYLVMRQKVQAESVGVPPRPDQRDALDLLEEEQRADIAKVLTPAELENYELRTSRTATVLRSQLAAFAPTEAEFRAIFAVTRSAEARFGSIGDAGNQRQIEGEVRARASAVLGPERFNVFLRTTPFGP